MTSAEWEEATTEVDFVAAKPARDTEPAPPPTEPAHDRPSQQPRDFEEIGGLYYAKPCEHCRELFDHDPACPHSPAVAP